MMKNYVCKSADEVVKALKTLVEDECSGSIAYDDCTCFYSFFKAKSGVTKIFHECSFSDVDAWESLLKLELGGYYYAGKFYNTAYGILPCNRGYEDEVMPVVVVSSSNWREMLPPVAMELMKKKYSDLNSLKKVYPDWVEDARVCFYESEDSLKKKVLTDNVEPKKSPFEWVNERVNVEDLILIDAGDMTSSELMEKTLERYKEDAVKTLARYYFYMNAIEKVRKNLTPDDKVFQQISESIRGLQNESANITVHILGDNSLLNSHTKHHFPDYSIEGKDIVLKVSVRDFQMGYSCGLIHLYYGSSLLPVLRDGYSNRHLMYIDDLPLSAIQSISYGRKTLYKIA